MKLVKTYDENYAQMVVASIETLGETATNLEDFLDNKIDNYSATECAGLLVRLKEAHDAIDAVKKRFYNIKDRLDKGIVPTKMEQEDVDKIRVPILALSFTILTKSSASIPDKEKGYQWLRDNGLGDIIQETVNAGTLASALRSKLLEEGVEPNPEEDGIKYNTYKAMSINKYTPPKGSK